MKRFSKIALLSLAFTTFAEARPVPKPWVLLIPGAASSGDSSYIRNIPGFVDGKYFEALRAKLDSMGMETLVCPEDADQDQRSLEEREEACVQTLLKRENRNYCDRLATRDVVVLGHSMGGLVARELAHDSRVSMCIRSVTTVSTPHLGTPLADFAIEHGDNQNPLDFYHQIVTLIGFTRENLRYLTELSVERNRYPASNFQAQDIPDGIGVQYYSISTSVKRDYTNIIEILRSITEKEIHARGLDQTSYGALNDGVVPEYSQIYGTYVGHLEANHVESSGGRFMKDTDQAKAARDFIAGHLATLMGIGQ